ncbi:MAG: hypothetical protein AB7O97_01900 [Planctomycetota bacterium]
MHPSSPFALFAAGLLAAVLPGQSTPAGDAPNAPPADPRTDPVLLDPWSEPRTPAMDTATEAAAPAPRLRGSLGVDVASAYYFRGILQERDGAIVQPWFEFTRPLFVGPDDGPVRAVDLTVGSWSSLHDGPSGSGGGQSMWYEHDAYVSLAAGLGARWTVEALYTSYYSPNGLFATVQEVGARVAFDDHGVWFDDVALQPSLMVVTETSGQADGGASRGTYLEASITPTLRLQPSGVPELTLTTPLTVGLGLDSYYENGGDGASLGFVDLGLVLAQSSASGEWHGQLGVHALLLGDTNEARNGGDDLEVVFSFSLASSF